MGSCSIIVGHCLSGFPARRLCHGAIRRMQFAVPAAWEGQSRSYKELTSLCSFHLSVLVQLHQLLHLLPCLNCIMHLKSIFTAAALAGWVYANSPTYKYVAVFSIDGLHGSDVEKYVSLRPKSTIAALLEHGYEYTNAYTSAPSDSFPGTLNQFTGASPRTTGVWYDDVYDRAFYPPYSDSKTSCTGPPGAEGRP